ncbi:Chitin-binding type-1 domain-containing protein [Plasmodiophora brassicae]|uniref:Chitin-binding type-1 domain-containing protein n=1 Tax=Plasmodiophora brassicae TaxID=37360 RepID=A0A0G4J8J2_PLABS|nr:hypothetical protein PBRA_003507 [Plasmodiophora brassicae]SPQ99859.1 unnamed protein product [Plasmodiophora brassicae]
MMRACVVVALLAAMNAYGQTTTSSFYGSLTSAGVSDNGLCGPFFGSKGCPAGQSCSQYGFCGDSCDPTYSGWTGPFLDPNPSPGTCTSSQDNQCNPDFTTCCDDVSQDCAYASNEYPSPCTSPPVNFNDATHTCNGAPVKSGAGAGGGVGVTRGPGGTVVPRATSRPTPAPTPISLPNLSTASGLQQSVIFTAVLAAISFAFALYVQRQ